MSIVNDMKHLHMIGWTLNQGTCCNDINPISCGNCILTQETGPTGESYDASPRLWSAGWISTSATGPEFSTQHPDPTNECLAVSTGNQAEVVTSSQLLWGNQRFSGCNIVVKDRIAYHCMFVSFTSVSYFSYTCLFIETQVFGWHRQCFLLFLWQKYPWIS